MYDSNTIRRFIFHIAVIGAFSVLVMSSAFYNGVTSGNDFTQHYQFATTFHNSIISSEIYPSWADSQNQGYGDAAIRFYPPLAYYLLSVSYLISGDWFVASLLTFFLIFWIGGTGVYFWSKEEFSSNQSLLAAGLYVFAPYHVNQIYNNFLYAEFASSAIIPFCFLFVTRVCRNGKILDVLGLTVSFAFLVLTHLPLSIIGSIVLFIYALSLLKRKSFLSVLPKLGASILLGAAASSFYWLRMITEINWVKHSSETYFSRTFDYRENFLFAPQNILNFQTDTSVLWLADLMLLAILLISIPFTALFIKNRRVQTRFSISIALIFVVSFLMTTPLSRAIWDNLFFLQKVQFPWRWLGIVSMTGAVFASVGIIRLAELMNENKSHLLSIGLGLILTFYVFMSAFIIKQAVYLPREKFDQQLQNLETANSFDCWWTIWMKSDAFQIKEKLTIRNRETRISRWDSNEKEFEVSSGEAGHLRIGTFYYPHWTASVNHKPVEVERGEDSAILVAVPAEFSHIKLSFKEPVFVRFANFISVCCWTIFLLTFAFLLLKPHKVERFQQRV